MENEAVPTNGHSGKIYGLMTKILAEVDAIGKGRRNAEQNYAFRGIDDVYNMIHPLFAKHGVFMLPRVLSEESTERPTRSGGIMRFSKLTMAYDFFADDGSHVTVETVGEAMDTADKASNKAMSAAHKYGLLQTFCIPTGSTPDADANTPEEIVGEPRPDSKKSTSAQKCPECSGPMWDNRETKTGKQPDYKCKDKSCGKAVWLNDATPSNRKTFIQSISDALKLLNELNDSIVWTKATANQFVAENFDGLAGVDALDDTQLTGLLKLLDARVTTLKAPKPKGGDPKSDAIKRIRTEFEPEHVDAWLKSVHKGKALEDLSLDALIAGVDEIVPF